MILNEAVSVLGRDALTEVSVIEKLEHGDRDVTALLTRG
jgi:hypothetical protein